MPAIADMDLKKAMAINLRREPLETRKATLQSLLARASTDLRLNEHLEHANGVHVFEQACRMGLEGIVSKRKGSTVLGRLAQALRIDPCDLIRAPHRR